MTTIRAPGAPAPDRRRRADEVQRALARLDPAHEADHRPGAARPGGRRGGGSGSTGTCTTWGARPSRRRRRRPSRRARHRPGARSRVRGRRCRERATRAGRARRQSRQQAAADAPVEVRRHPHPRPVGAPAASWPAPARPRAAQPTERERLPRVAGRAGGGAQRSLSGVVTVICQPRGPRRVSRRSRPISAPPGAADGGDGEQAPPGSGDAIGIQSRGRRVGVDVGGGHRGAITVVGPPSHRRSPSAVWPPAPAPRGDLPPCAITTRSSGRGCRRQTTAPDLALRTRFLRARVKAGDRVLDLGCGEGHFLGPLTEAGAAVTGADVAQAALERARRRHPGARLCRASRSTASCPSAMGPSRSCGPVRSSSTWPTRARWLSEVRRVLVPRGRVLLTTPSHSRLRLALAGIEPVLRAAGGSPAPVHAPIAADGAGRVRLRCGAGAHGRRAAAACDGCCSARDSGDRGADRPLRVLIDAGYAYRTPLSGTAVVCRRAVHRARRPR